MKIKQNFNANLYREGLRRLTLTGSLFLSLMMIGAILIPLLILLVSHVDMRDLGYYAIATEVRGAGANISMAFVMPFFAPFATLVLFSFLNKRNSSDFFHSIPHRRETVFFSFTAALLTWIWGSIIITTMVSVAILGVGAIFGLVTLHIGSILLAMMYAMVGSLLMIAVVLLAMSVTGNVFSNIVTALLIIFLPRALISALTWAVILSVHEIVGFATLSFITNPVYNIAFTGGFLIAGSDMVGPIIYSLVLAVIYFALAVRFFKRRPSEMATSPAASRRTQLLVRTAVATAAAFPAAMIIFAIVTSFDELTPNTLALMAIGIVAFYSLAFVTYFAYEFISKKRVANFARLLPGLALVLAINIAFASSTFASHMFIVHRTLDVDNVRSVQIHEMGGITFTGRDSYETLNLQNFRFDDEEVVEILVRSLNRQLRRIRRGEGSAMFQTYNIIPITFNTNLGAVRRNVFLRHYDIWDLSNALRENEDFMRVSNEMPSPSRVRSITTSGSFGWSGSWLSGTQRLGLELPERDLRLVYEVLYEELKELCRFDMLFDRPTTAITFATIVVEGNVGRQQFSSMYDISCRTPRAAAKLLELVNAQNRERILDAFNTHGSVSIFTSGSYLRGPMTVYSVHAQAIIAAILQQVDNPVDITQPYFMVTLPTWGGHITSLRSPFFFNSECQEVLALLMPPTTR